MRTFIFILLISIMPITALAQRGASFQGGTPSHGMQGNGSSPVQFSPEAFNNMLEQFIKNEADLTQQECNEFFPIMHEMFAKKREIQHKIFLNIRKGHTATTEAEYERLINEITGLEIEDKRIEQIYYKKFHKVLSWRKIHKVRGALDRFYREALRKFTPHPQRPSNENPWQGGNNRRK